MAPCVKCGLNTKVDEPWTHRCSYITITRGMRGFFAVHVWWNPDGFYEPWQSGIGSYTTREEAVPEAKRWAEAEGLEFK